MKIRTVHHLPATGGTLVSKCIAALSQVRLLSEIDPLGSTGGVGFQPRELFRQYRNQYGIEGEDTHRRYFLAQIKLVYELCKADEKMLVIRDHAQTQFQKKNSNMVFRRSLLEFLGDYDLLSLVTIRDPIDSFLGCSLRGWLGRFSDTFDGYCEAYLRFMESYDGIPYIRYEEFCLEPEKRMEEICKILEVRFEPGFVTEFASVTLTGDSGRTGNTIAPRDRRPVEASFVDAVLESPHYARFCQDYGYSSNPVFHLEERQS